MSIWLETVGAERVAVGRQDQRGNRRTLGNEGTGFAPRSQPEAKQDKAQPYSLLLKGKTEAPRARMLPQAHSLLAGTSFPSCDLERVQSWPFFPQRVWGEDEGERSCQREEEIGTGTKGSLNKGKWLDTKQVFGAFSGKFLGLIQGLPLPAGGLHNSRPREGRP